MIFPVTGFPCSAETQRTMRTVPVRTGRVVLRDFHDGAEVVRATQASTDEIFVAKAAWLSELIYRVLLRIRFSVTMPEKTRAGVAEFLAVKPNECDHALVGLLYLTAVNTVMQKLAACFAGFERIPELDYLAATAAGNRLLRLLTAHAGSIDEQLEALILHNPGLITAEERDLIRRIIRYDQGIRHLSGSGAAMAGSFSAPTMPGLISRSVDAPWMRELVLIAKIVPVWLADIRRRYGVDAWRLDQIPEKEIARIAGFGVNGIWLVGLWQRSAASARIKTLTGGKNYASAYSVFDYTVADEWGGEAGLRQFRGLCERYGIRLGCDMVPNHTGIDSLWMREHPDWFMQTDSCPFPGYTFNGENLSGAPGIEIRIEDHYYSRSDAAVVFACDRDGKRRYIYHGNDGTGLPWNDTAQLDHTRADVRRAIIDTALRLAENFSIIRFDAAMTLTRDHYRRLWFPPADAAPAIASRSVYGLSGAEFDARMSEEFWVELVRAFRGTKPDTLLVAEAFWMTEMYFVRSLGLHRVYNSAFMHSLRDEKNPQFMQTLRTFRAEDADTLSRFVNYLSTPDEEAAAALFHNDEKYLAAMTLMATLPGLPMLAPGQLEGYREKYGMDQEAPQSGESVRDDLAEKFSAQITPLLRLRSEFADPLAITFPACEKKDHCIVFETGVQTRFLVLVNNAPQATAVRFAASDFSRIFPPAADTLSWTDMISGGNYSAVRTDIEKQGAVVPLAPYQSVVLTNFSARETARAERPRGQYPIAGDYLSGVAIPVAALRSHLSGGIGEFTDLKLLIDWCATTGQSIINLLPVNDTGTNSSPYSALSAMALHPVYLRLDALPLTQPMREKLSAFRRNQSNHERVNFSAVAEFKQKFLRDVYLRDRDEAIASVPRAFREQPWVIEYAVYRTLKDRFGGSAHFQWQVSDDLPEDVAALVKRPDRDQVAEYFHHHIKLTGFYVWLQYQLHKQLSEVKTYADERGVYLKGDMPIMLERDSVDVWLNPHLFDHRLRAGAPPDMFSPEGQNWGFPVYNWAEHERENFRWWRLRITQLAQYFSAYRIDHVLGFFRLWCIEESNYSGEEGFFRPSYGLDDSGLAELIPDEADRCRLSRVVMSDAEAAAVPAIDHVAGLACLAAHAENEKGIQGLNLPAEISSALFSKLHSRALLPITGRYFPAWYFSEKLGRCAVPNEQKRRLEEKICQLKEQDQPMQREHGRKILAVLKAESGMLPCAEDLGVVPDYVRPTLAEIGMLSLKVFRWEAENNIPRDPKAYPYLSLATSSVHDSSNLREWLQGEPARITGVQLDNGRATAAHVRQFLSRLYSSPSMVVMIPLQDLLALDERYHGDAAAERVNIPGTVSDFNWTYRMPLLLEDLLSDARLADAVRGLAALRPKPQ